MWNAEKRLTLSVAYMEILKRLLLFTFQYSQNIFGIAIIKKRNTYRGKWESDSVIRDT